MEQKELVVPVRVSPAMFREFGMFDTFSRQKRWRSPLVFALLMSVFAVVAFTQAGRIRGAALLGGVLLLVGLGLPAAYFLSFFLSLKKQERALAQTPGVIVYTLHLSGEGFSVLQGQEKVAHTWDQVLLACRLSQCMCLYVGPRRAYLLPDWEGSRQEEAVWRLIQDKVPEDRRRVRGA